MPGEILLWWVVMPVSCWAIVMGTNVVYDSVNWGIKCVGR